MPTYSIEQQFARLEALRETIATLQAERDAVAQQQRSRAEVVAVIDGYVAMWREAADSNAKSALVRASVGAAALPLHAHLPPSGGMDLGAILVAAIGPEIIREQLLKHIDVVPVGLDKAERAARLAELAGQLDAAEFEEETVVCELELMGQQVRRRPDARAEIILAVEV